MILDPLQREPEVLPIEQLALQQPNKEEVKRRLLSGASGAAFCPCDLVKTFLIDHETAYSILARLEEQERWICISLPEIFSEAPQIRVIPRAQREREERVSSRNDLTSVSSRKDTIAFIAPQLKNDVQAILNEPHIRAFEMVIEVSSWFVPNYREKLLTEHPQSDKFRHNLRRAFQFLSRLDLATEELASAKFAHSSVIMLISRALGTDEPEPLVSYVDHPASFIASALANALALSINEHDRLRSQLQRLVDEAPLDQRQIAEKASFTFLRGDAIAILRSIVRSGASDAVLVDWTRLLDRGNQRVRELAGSLSGNDAMRLLEAIKTNRRRVHAESLQ